MRISDWSADVCSSDRRRSRNGMTGDSLMGKALIWVISSPDIFFWRSALWRLGPVPAFGGAGAFAVIQARSICCRPSAKRGFTRISDRHGPVDVEARHPANWLRRTANITGSSDRLKTEDRRTGE